MGWTCGLIIIGDEILKGQTADTNSRFLCRKLFHLGVSVKKIVVISDDVSEIAREVVGFSNIYDLVLTSGGLGPTHDDVTYQGVAVAFDEPLVQCSDIATALKEQLPDAFHDENQQHPALKMALVPASAVLHNIQTNDGKLVTKFPLVSVKNVFIFPGIPAHLERAFEHLEDLFHDPHTHFHVREVFLNEEEANLAGLLNEISKQFAGKVSIGSYPEVDNSYFRTRVTLQAENVADAVTAEQSLKSAVNSKVIVEYNQRCISEADKRIYDLANGCDDTSLAMPVASIIKVLDDCLDQYGLHKLCLCFNGGKDCTALLHILYGVLMHKYPEGIDSLQALYITSGQPFNEVEDFITESVSRYNLKLLRYEGPIKDGLSAMKKQHPHIQAVFMGTRRTDPSSNKLQTFQMTDPTWPQVMRVSPLLDWHYNTVWKLLRTLSVPYCLLYDKGYTSLGNFVNTKKNPRLVYKDSIGNDHYYPAYFLKDSSVERDGRV